MKRLTRQQLIENAARRLIAFSDANPDCEVFAGMAEDAAERGMTSAKYEAELIEDLRHALAEPEGR